MYYSNSKSILAKTLFMLCMLGLPILSQAKQITYNLLTDSSNIKVIKNYSTVLKSGKIKAALCLDCEPQEFQLNEQSRLLLHGKRVPLEQLLKASLQYKEKDIRIQYYQHTMLVNYIEWGQDPREVGAPL